MKNLTNEQKKELQLNNAYLITEYQKNLYDFLFISPIYNKEIYKILKASREVFEFAEKNGSIEIVVFSSVKTMGELFVEYTEEEIANDLTKSIYGLTIEEAEKKLQEFKNHFERK
jgi:nucleoside-diphosphate-sugar epimerase